MRGNGVLNGMVNPALAYLFIISFSDITSSASNGLDARHWPSLS
jgi:hypothetical protein